MAFARTARRTAVAGAATLTCVLAAPLAYADNGVRVTPNPAKPTEWVLVTAGQHCTKDGTAASSAFVGTQVALSNGSGSAQIKAGATTSDYKVQVTCQGQSGVLNGFFRVNRVKKKRIIYRRRDIYGPETGGGGMALARNAAHHDGVNVPALAGGGLAIAAAVGTGLALRRRRTRPDA